MSCSRSLASRCDAHKRRARAALCRGSSSRFRRRPMALLLLIAAILLGIIGCGGRPVDPRALPRSEPGASLAEALNSFGLPMPRHVLHLRYGLLASIDTGLELEFESSCADAKAFISGAGLPPLGPPGRIPSLVSGAIEEYGWPIDRKTARGTESAPGGNGPHLSMVLSVDGERCVLALSGAK